jgi:hypothetical protein
LCVVRLGEKEPERGACLNGRKSLTGSTPLQLLLVHGEGGMLYAEFGPFDTFTDKREEKGQDDDEEEKDEKLLDVKKKRRFALDDVRLGVVTSMKMHTMDVSKFQSTFWRGRDHSSFA